MRRRRHRAPRQHRAVVNTRITEEGIDSPARLIFDQALLVTEAGEWTPALRTASVRAPGRWVLHCGDLLARPKAGVAREPDTSSRHSIVRPGEANTSAGAAQSRTHARKPRLCDTHSAGPARTGLKMSRRFGKQILVPRRHLGGPVTLADRPRRCASRVGSRASERVDHDCAVEQAHDPARRPRRLAVHRVTAMTPSQDPRTTDFSMTDECTGTRVCGGVG